MHVTVRKKKLADGRESLYLDIYQGKGRRRKKSLGLYLTGNKKKDRETMRVAEQVRVKRQADLDAGRLGMPGQSTLTVGGLVLSISASRSEKFQKVCSTVNQHLVKCGIGSISVSSLTASDCEQFDSYLRHLLVNETIMTTSAATYMQVFRVAVRRAYRQGLIPVPLHDRFGTIRGYARTREYLTLEEARALIATPYKEPYRSIVIFGLLTGLRLGEMERLRWADLDGDMLKYYQPKTRKWGYRRISRQALDAIESMREKTYVPANYVRQHKRMLRDRIGHIWAWWPNGGGLNRNLKIWVKEAGIRKDITMHCLRHTFATLQLSAGTPIETVSALLSHGNIKTTQIYVNILDRAIDDAADRIELW